MSDIDNRPWNFAGAPIAELEKIHLPKAADVEAVCDALNIRPEELLRTHLYQTVAPTFTRWLLAVVRGDHEIDEAKLARSAGELFGITSLKRADSPDARSKWPIEFLGPDAAMKAPDAVLLVDPDAARGDVEWAAGGNEIDLYVTHFNWFRECGDRLADPSKVNVADIR